MKIIDYTEAETHVVESGEMKGVVGRIVIGKADGADNFCMRVFELPKGASREFIDNGFGFFSGIPS